MGSNGCPAGRDSCLPMLIGHQNRVFEMFASIVLLSRAAASLSPLHAMSFAPEPRGFIFPPRNSDVQAPCQLLLLLHTKSSLLIVSCLLSLPLLMSARLARCLSHAMRARWLARGFIPGLQLPLLDALLRLQAPKGLGKPAFQVNRVEPT